MALPSDVVNMRGNDEGPHMTRPPSISPALLERAVRAARDALHHMDDDDVPSALRRVAASSARRLPPPLLMTLLDFLDDAEWLRAAAGEQWQEADVEDPDPRQAVSAMFLIRPEGWEQRASSLIAAAGTADAGRQLDEIRRDNERLLRLVDDLTERLEEARAAEANARAAGQARAAAALARVEDARRSQDRRRLELEAELVEASSLLSTRESDLAEADARIDDLRARIARRGRPSEAGEMHGFGRGDSIELARDLDRLMEAVRPIPAERSAGIAAPEPPALPAGVRPDQAAAVDWLLGMATPVRVLVDGFNVAHEFVSPPDATVRRRVEDVLVRLRRLATMPLHIVVFWDSALGQEQRPVRGLDTRYVPDADAAIAEAVHTDDRPTVIVTSDREIHDRTIRPSVVVIWSRALVEWSRR